MGILALLRGLARELGPYLIIELLLPGGSLLALLLFLCRRGKFSSDQGTSMASGAKRSLMQVWNELRSGRVNGNLVFSQTIRSVR